MKLSTIQRIKDPDTRARLLHKYTKDHQISRTRDTILACQACVLHSAVKAPVPWSGPIPSPIVFVGEAPGVEEDRFGIPFVGKAGRLFDHLLTTAGLDRDDYFVANSLCCRPPSNRDPFPAEIAACQPNLTAQLDLSGAWVGVTLGSFALAAVSGRTRSQVKITAERGKPVLIDGRIWIPTFHPAYALRNPAAGKVILEDIRAADSLQKGEETLPTAAYLEMADNWATADGLVDKLSDQGYAVVNLHRMEDTVVVTRDSDVSIPDTIPASYVVYTLEELLRMGEFGKAARFNTVDYKRIHLVKKILGATVIS
jgi:DNA polymerase